MIKSYYEETQEIQSTHLIGIVPPSLPWNESYDEEMVKIFTKKSTLIMPLSQYTKIGSLNPGDEIKIRIEEAVG